MTIEAALAALTAAVQENTAAIKAAGGAAPAATATAAAPAADAGKKPRAARETTAAAAAPTSKYSKEEMVAALNELKEKKGVPAAKDIIKNVGKQDKMADIVDPAVIDAVYDAAKAALDDEGDM